MRHLPYDLDFVPDGEPVRIDRNRLRDELGRQLSLFNRYATLTENFIREF